MTLKISVIRRHSVYCLVDEVLRREKIMPDEKKDLAIQFFFYFSSDVQEKHEYFYSKSG